MSLREGYPQPRSYCLSFSRDAAVRTVRLRPAVVWSIVALALILFAWTSSVTLYLAFHDDVMGAILAHEAKMKAAYEDRLAEARGELDEAASRQLLERNAFKGAANEIISRQARLEQRGAIVEALAETEVRNSSQPARRETATTSRRTERHSGAQSPDVRRGKRGRHGARLRPSSAEPRPVKPHPIDESRDSLSALPSEAPFTTASVTGAEDNLDPSARLALVNRSLDRIEGAEAKALAAVDRVARRSASRDAAIVAETGLDPDETFAPAEAGRRRRPLYPGRDRFERACAGSRD